MSRASIRTFMISSARDADGAAAASKANERLALGLGLADQPLEGPVAALLDARRDRGQRRDRAERAAAAGELERRDVVLDAVVVAGERRRPEEVDRAVRSDEPATGERRTSGQEESQQRCREDDAESPHRSVSWAVGPGGSALAPVTPSGGTEVPAASVAERAQLAATRCGRRRRRPRPGCREPPSVAVKTIRTVWPAHFVRGDAGLPPLAPARASPAPYSRKTSVRTPPTSIHTLNESSRRAGRPVGEVVAERQRRRPRTAA